MSVSKKLIVSSIFIVSMAVASPQTSSSINTQEVKHYKGETVESIEQAHTNLVKYNDKLTNILLGEISAKEMSQIHEITYTLENALMHIAKEIKQLQENLEKIHIASEKPDSKTIRKIAPEYISKSKQLFEK